MLPFQQCQKKSPEQGVEVLRRSMGEWRLALGWAQNVPRFPQWQYLRPAVAPLAKTAPDSQGDERYLCFELAWSLQIGRSPSATVSPSNSDPVHGIELKLLMAL